MSFHIGDRVIVHLPRNIQNYAEEKQKYNNTTAIITDMRHTSMIGYIYRLNNDKNIYFREDELSERKSRLQFFLEESVKNEKNLEKGDD